jgi:hypothetical protein
VSETEEQWKPVTTASFEHLYEVSDWGRIRKKKTGVLLRGSPAGPKRGLQIKFRHTYGGTTKNCMLSHLVMAAFGEDPCGRSVSHLDKNPRNCRFSNLVINNSSSIVGGHRTEGLVRSMADLSQRIWQEILPETLPLLSLHAGCRECGLFGTKGVQT